MTKKGEFYPQFISNHPCGIDKFEGKSQERLTNAVANHIISTDKNNNTQKLSRIIGLEGGWGVGKSNVIKQLKNQAKIKKGYFLFEYDAWGHQEDLQRRSFLETLTTELIEEKILSGKTEINVKGGCTKKVTWKEKLKYLLARKTETSTEKRPKLSIGIITFIITTIFTSIAISIADTLKAEHFYLSIFLPFIPFLIAAIILILWAIFGKKSLKNIFNEIFSIYNGKIENEISFETISEEEPTVTEFKNWMRSISDHLEGKEKKVIIVYDNMDRLPTEKVKELWSSIHTFFSEDGFENIWAVIPFDQKHLASAFGESDDKEKLTKYFISKTFPVVYSVKPPVITDFKSIFNSLFKEAFGSTATKSQDDINRIFRLERPNATVREIIEYINRLVALSNIWKDEIGLLYIAIFELKKDVIINNPIELILSGDYLGKYIPKIVTNDEILQKHISALTYGVSLIDAEQIPISKYIDSCFNLENNTDINKYSTSSTFIHILSDKIKNSDFAQLDNIIKCLSNLDTTTLSEPNQDSISSLWNLLANRKKNSSLSNQEFDKTYKLLIQNIDNNHKNNVIKRFCKQVQFFKEFNSENYFNALNELEEFLKVKNIDINITDFLDEIDKDSETFITYILYAKDKYPVYKLTIKPDILTEYLVDNMTENYSKLEILRYLNNDKKFQFDKVKEKIEETIQNPQLVNENNFKLLLESYKTLSDKGQLSVQLSHNQRQSLWNVLASKTNTLEFLEIATMQIANGQNIGVSLDNEQIIYIADNIDYYADYGQLLINNLSWNIPVLTQVLKYMTEKKLGQKLTLEKVLSKFIEIKNNLGVSDHALLKQLNDWEKYKETIEKDNIQQVIPNAQFFQFSKNTKNSLTDYLNKTIIEALSTIQPIQILQYKQQQPNNYWIVVINNLIDTDFLKSLPNNLTELAKKCLDDIAASRLPIPNENDILYKIINKLDRRKTKETITHIRNQICNNVPGYNVNANKFIFLHDWLKKQGDLNLRSGDVTQYILNPIVNNDNCLKVLIDNDDFYAKIINSAGEQANTFLNNITNKLQNSENANLISFAKKIGVENENQFEE